jgi:hypothetical protein
MVMVMVLLTDSSAGIEAGAEAEDATETEAEAAAGSGTVETASAVAALTAATGGTATELPSALHPSHGMVQMATEHWAQNPALTVGRALGDGARKVAASHRQQQVEAGVRQKQQQQLAVVAGVRRMTLIQSQQ